MNVDASCRKKEEEGWRIKQERGEGGGGERGGEGKGGEQQEMME